MTLFLLGSFGKKAIGLTERPVICHSSSALLPTNNHRPLKWFNGCYSDSQRLHGPPLRDGSCWCSVLIGDVGNDGTLHFWLSGFFREIVNIRLSCNEHHWDIPVALRVNCPCNDEPCIHVNKSLCLSYPWKHPHHHHCRYPKVLRLCFLVRVCVIWIKEDSSSYSSTFLRSSQAIPPHDAEWLFSAGPTERPEFFFCFFCFFFRSNSQYCKAPGSSELIMEACGAARFSHLDSSSKKSTEHSPLRFPVSQHSVDVVKALPGVGVLDIRLTTDSIMELCYGVFWHRNGTSYIHGIRIL